jgi:hypothetical protein
VWIRAENGCYGVFVLNTFLRVNLEIRIYILVRCCHHLITAMRVVLLLAETAE